MAKKIKLSEIKLKSSVVELNQKQRKASKGGYFNKPRATRFDTLKAWIADTQVDIRFHDGRGSDEEGITQP